jgi:N-acetyl sugar amidotransferase
MDTTDPDIEFDDDGVCNHCKRYDAKKATLSDERHLRHLVEKMKRHGQGRRYDCLVGVSGGVDSTYTAHLLKELGLRPLAVHMDNGWDSELAVSNIEKTLNKLSIDLYTYVLDWEEFKDLQLAFLKASTADSEIPTDHAIMAVLYRMANDARLKYIILGSNVATEAIMPNRWSTGHADWRYINNIQKRFGTRKLKSFPHYSLKDLLFYRRIEGIRVVNLLNYVDYDKKEAMRVLQDELGWVYYGGKHYESVYTRFFQGYILPRKFSYDKRRAHLSTLVCSGQMTREQALKEMTKDPYPSEELKNEDKEYVLKKLEMTNEDFERIMRLPKKTIWDYPSYQGNPLYRAIRSIYSHFGFLSLTKNA